MSCCLLPDISKNAGARALFYGYTVSTLNDTVTCTFPPSLLDTGPSLCDGLLLNESPVSVEPASTSAGLGQPTSLGFYAGIWHAGVTS